MEELNIIIEPELEFSLKKCGEVVPYGITPEEREKLAGIEENANNYTHPAKHPASIITQDANNRFVTDAEKTTWNAKASTDVATTSVAGLMSSSDKTKLDGIATGANNYTHPETHPASILDVVDVVNGATNKFMNERGEMVAVAHESLTDKNSEAAFQHIDTTTTKPALDAADMVAVKDSVTGKMVLTPKSNLQTDLTSVNQAITNLQNDKADKTQEAWITPTLLNGWEAVTGYPVGYRLDSMKKLHFKGRIIKSTSGVNTIFVLPTGYKTTIDKQLVAVNTTGTFPYNMSRIVIEAGSGNVWIREYLSATVELDLNQISCFLD